VLLALSVAAGAGCAAGSSSPPAAVDDNPLTDASSQDVANDRSTLIDAEDSQPDVELPDVDEPDRVVAPPCDNADKTGDLDDDGWSVNDGDCNDCSDLINPGAYDFPGGVDEDCNGTADDEPVCDQGELAEDSNDPWDAARALGLCRKAVRDAPLSERTWGVLSAEYVFPDGTTKSLKPMQGVTMDACVQGGGWQDNPPHPMSHGILSKFGKEIVPRGGKAMLALSSGIARSGAVGPSPAQAKMCTASNPPTGFPSKWTCPGPEVSGDKKAYDGIALALEIRVPTNVKGFSFDFNFFTYEFPSFVCQRFNDFFVALLSGSHTGGALSNVSFDNQGNPVSVNNGFLEVCKPQVAGGKDYPCPYGSGQLVQTGFDGHGSTGWLRTSIPVKPGEVIKLRFAIWDMGDDAADSTVLLDNFTWYGDSLPAATDRPPW